MNKMALTISALLLSTSGAFAQTAVTDGNGDGVFSLEELQIAYPDLSAATFSEIDVDGSGAVDADELQAAREQGLIAA